MLAPSPEEMLRRHAAAALGQVVEAIDPAGAGANSRVYRLRSGGRTLALKTYPAWRVPADRRAAVEWRALRVLRGHGVDEVPLPVAVDADRGLLVMEWIDGTSVSPITDGDVEAALAFIGRVFQLSARADAADFSEASEACLCGDQITRQIEARRAAFVSLPALDAFLAESFAPAFDRARERAQDYDGYASPLARRQRRLIAADFGFHNALRQPGRGLRFLDFDYFGWDDPVKLAADIVLHPAMDLSDRQTDRVLSGMQAMLPDDPTFRRRFDSYHGLFALRWALIVLNMFRADRQSSAVPDPTATAQGRGQIEKAARLIDQANAAVSMDQV